MKRRRYGTHGIMSQDKKHTVTVILIWSGAVLFAVFLALLLGNILGNAADRIPRGSSLSDPVFKYEANHVPPIDNARILSVHGQTNDSFAAAVNALPSNVKSVSLYLRVGKSAPYYKSAVSQEVTGKAGGTLDLDMAVNALHARNIYVSCCVDIFSPSTEDESARDAAIQYEAALVAEIASAGVDDIILTKLPSGHDKIAAASKLFAEIRSKNENVVLGAGIGYEILQSDGGAAALEGYSSFASFCAVDTSGSRATGKTSGTIAKNLLYCFERYPLRILVEGVGENDFLAQVATLNELGIYNIQHHKNVSGTAAG